MFFAAEFSQLSLIISFIIMICFYTLISLKWNLIQTIFKIPNYNKIQRVHHGEVPRLGGLISYIGLLIFSILCDRNQVMPFIDAILISSIPILVVTTSEDIYGNTSPFIRIACMIVSTFIFFSLYPITFPILDIVILNDLFVKYPFLNYIFYSICVLIIINGYNMIDGANGLLAMTSLAQFFCLMFLFNYVGDDYLSATVVYPVGLLLLFIIFNYPLGKIFMGDFGAYFFGFFISLLIINFFGNNPSIPTWNAVLILFYPAFEVLFSVIRKIRSKKNPLYPDLYHLHLKVINVLKASIPKNYNNLVTLFLSIIWISPFYLLVFVFTNPLLIILSICCLMIIYIVLYKSIIP